MHRHRSRRRIEHHVAAGVQSHALGTIDTQSYAPGIGVRGEHKVVFELPVAAVVNDVDAGVHRGIAHPGNMRYRRQPVLGIATAIVAAMALQARFAARSRGIVGIHQAHPYHVSGSVYGVVRGPAMRRAAEHHGGAHGLQRHAVTAATQEVIAACSELTLIGLEIKSR